MGSDITMKFQYCKGDEKFPDKKKIKIDRSLATMDYITTYMAKSFSLEEPKNITLVLKNVNFSFSGDF